MEIPVYLFTGFLESGKTKFIQETLENEEFNTKEKTLVLMCEEGIEGLDTSRFAVENVTVLNIENAEDINKKNIGKINQKYTPERVLIEYNGMWKIDDIYKSFPADWSVYQEIFTANAQSFINYNQNMRTLTVDKLTSCELVLFNRVTVTTSLEELHKIVRGISQRANIAYEFTDGHIEEDTIEDPLPYDIDADIIEIEDKDYAIWYRDLSEEPEKYVGKILKLKGIVGREQQLGDKAFVFGRHVMTCCVEDIAFRGLICKSKDRVDLKNRDWAVVTAKLVIGEHKVYGGEGPILIAQKIEKSQMPEQEVATFY